MSIRHFPRRRLSSLLLAAALFPGLTGCGQSTEGVSQQGASLQETCVAAPPNVVFFENFDGGLGQFKLDAASGGHTFSVDATPPLFAGTGQLRSDPSGQTMPVQSTAVTTPSLNLSGRHQTVVNFMAKYSLADGDSLSVVATGSHGSREIGHLSGQNGTYPDFDLVTLNMGDFDGDSGVQVTIRQVTGNKGGSYGVAIDNLQISARPDALPQGVVFSEDFQDGLGRFPDYSSPYNEAGHRFAPLPRITSCPGFLELRSDPIGITAGSEHARLGSHPGFTLVGKTHATLTLRGRFQQAGNDYLALTLLQGNGGSEIMELHGQNPSFPNPDSMSVDISLAAGLPDIYIAVDEATGTRGSNFGAGIESITVTAQ